MHALRPGLLLLAFLLLATACSAERDAGGGGEARTIKQGDAIPTSDVDPGQLPDLGHVHGLGMNPADDAIYIATHYGLWRMAAEGSEPERVGEHAHDFMGFSVVGEDHFVASGHPNSAEGLPGLLGLIESTDAGLTWRSRSLLGEADFHGLHVAGEQTFGWNSASGDLLASSDLEEWQTRSKGVMLVDFAVDPADVDRLVGAVAVSRERLELQRSSDGGRTWKPVDDAPSLTALAWPDAGRLWGFDMDGAVWSSRDGGLEWRRTGGKVGGPAEAVAAVAGAGDGAGLDGVLLAAAAGSILRSTDGGRSWDSLHRYGG